MGLFSLEAAPPLEKKVMDEEGSDQGLLREVVIDNSVAKTWKQARMEWSLSSIFYEPSNCICNHFIMENCVIKNQYNGGELVVGNECINHFERKELQVSKPARAAHRRLVKDVEKVSMSEALLEVAIRCKVLTKNDVERYRNITTGPGSRLQFESQSKTFSPKLFEMRKKMNKKVRYAFSRDNPYKSPPIFKTQDEYDDFMIGLEESVERDQKRQKF